MSDIKRMDIKEFQQAGYLQEVNRQFFHPLGLALAVRSPEKEGDPWALDSIWDCCDDPEGVYFEDLGEADVAGGRAIEAALKARSAARIQKLGYVIQPLDEGPS